MNDQLTLQQGLDAFSAKNQHYFSDRAHSREGKAFLRCHDIAHVIFGCDTSIYGEGTVKIWTSFGTTSSFLKVVSGYQEVRAFQLFKQYSASHIIKHVFRFLRDIPRTLLRVNQMSKPWPFTAYHPYLNTPLADIRQEFNIKTV